MEEREEGDRGGGKEGERLLTLLVKLIEMPSNTIVPTKRRPPPVKKDHWGMAPFMRSIAPTPVTIIETLCRI